MATQPPPRHTTRTGSFIDFLRRTHARSRVEVPHDLSASRTDLRTASRRGIANSPVRPLRPRSLNRCRNAFGPAIFARAWTRVLNRRAVSITQVAGRIAGNSHFQRVFGNPRAAA